MIPHLLKLPDGCILGAGQISGSATKAPADFSGQHQDSKILAKEPNKYKTR